MLFTAYDYPCPPFCAHELVLSLEPTDTRKTQLLDSEHPFPLVLLVGQDSDRRGEPSQSFGAEDCAICGLGQNCLRTAEEAESSRKRNRTRFDSSMISLRSIRRRMEARRQQVRRGRNPRGWNRPISSRFNGLAPEHCCQGAGQGPQLAPGGLLDHHRCHHDALFVWRARTME